MIKLRKIKVNLEKAKIHSGFFFGNDKLIQEIKARSDSPFGITSIDFPEFHFWLQNQSPIFKKEYINKRLLPYYPIRDAIFTLLLILRSNAKTSNVFTEGGVYQRKLDPASKIDLVTITAKKSLRGFPAISSNKYAINIHFNDSKTQIKVEKIINFKISLASL